MSATKSHTSNLSVHISLLNLTVMLMSQGVLGRKRWIDIFAHITYSGTTIYLFFSFFFLVLLSRDVILSSHRSGGDTISKRSNIEHRKLVCVL